LHLSRNPASVTRCIQVWTVAQAVNFQVVPLEYRVLFGNMIALWWNIYLSLASHTPE
jgi:hypothetical protein